MADAKRHLCGTAAPTMSIPADRLAHRVLTTAFGIALAASSPITFAAPVPLEAEAATEEKDDRDEPEGEAPLAQVQVTATRRAESNFDVPTAVTVVGRDEIREIPALTVSDYLRGHPGLFVQATTPGQAIPIVRGLKGSEVLHIVDGFRLNTAFFRNSPNQYFALVDAQNVDRIDVVRGPSSTLYGSDAMGGVVHVLTPEERFEGGSWSGRGRFRAQHATGDVSSLGRIDGAAGRDGLSFSGGVTVQDVGERRLGGDGRRLPYTDFSAWAADAKMLWSPTPGHELMLSGQFLKQPKTPRVDELVTGFNQTRPNSSEFYFQPQERSFAQARYTIEAESYWFDRAEFHAGYQEIVDDRRTREFQSVNREIEQNTDRLRGYSGVFTKELGAHALVWGAEAYFDTVTSARQRLNLTTNALTVRPPRFPDGSTMDSYGVFLEDAITLAPRWQFDIGARYNWFDIELPANAQGVGVKLEPDDLTGNAGLTFRATDDVHLVSNIGRGFRAPNIFDLGVFGDRPSNRFSIPNPDLKPETVVTWDLGIKIENGTIQAETFYWQSRYTDKITSVDTGEVLPNGRLVVQNRNVTELDLWGIEAGLRWYASPQIEMYGVINLTRGEETYAGSQYDADRIPPLNGRLGMLYRFAEDFDVEGYAVYAARQDDLSPRDLQDPRVNPAGTAGWNTMNVRLGWAATDDATLGLQFTNLADRRYREHGSGADETGRSVTATLDWNF